MSPQAPFGLALPPTEIKRITSNYVTLSYQESDVSTYPDLLILTSVLEQQQVLPHPGLYAEIYTNEVFSVFTRLHSSGVFSAGPPPPTPGR